ncbi:polysaccharide pyruvyl transferase family protein [Methylobacterium marchantiae]|uniref:Polysaccharide pyruvyl transferase family protein n=1 Tax=Methylobacterium marchantiae TaxID=600331 RepID=A0ABW3X453_9HYPH
MIEKEKLVSKSLSTFVKNGDTAGFLELEATLLAESAKEWAPLINSYRALLKFEEMAREAGLEEQYRPKMWWMRSPYPGNFGDILTPYVLWHAFGVMPRWASSNQAEGLCIGSIAKFARPGVRLWGTGMPRPSDPLCPTAIYAAVRGPLSRDAVLAAGGECPEIYGDPAVLLPELFTPETTKTHKVGIIAHVLQEAEVRAAVDKLDAKHIKVISLLAASFEDIERVIADIVSCEEIVTTSLHGLIVSHAYGIPAQYMNLNGETNSFKMQDYKMSVGLSDAALRGMREFTDLKWLDARQCVLPPSRIDTAALRSAFPFPTRL